MAPQETRRPYQALKIVLIGTYPIVKSNVPNMRFDLQSRILANFICLSFTHLIPVHKQSEPFLE
ncbi:MAG: hypothetical protein ACFFHV_07530 [Promethearchaeota archaeon]